MDVHDGASEHNHSEPRQFLRAWSGMTLRDDAPPEVRGQAVDALRCSRVEAIRSSGWPSVDCSDVDRSGGD